MEATTQTSKVKFYNPFSWNWKLAFETAREYAETLFVFLFIITGLATFLILVGWLPAAGETFKRIVGSLSFAYSVFALLAFLNKGVKHQSSNKKKSRR